jgi:DNA excision repair protein ERCC-3
VIDDDGDFNDEGLALPKGAMKSFSRRYSLVGGRGLYMFLFILFFFVYRKKKDLLDDQLFPLGDYSKVPLLRDHAQRPLWITEDGHIFLEMFHAARVYDFIITIAEPVFRPFLMHEYQLTPYSLYGAVSVGLNTATILNDLTAISKTELPIKVVNLIRDCTQSYGKAKLVLHQNRYFVESASDEVFEKLIRDEKIQSSRISSQLMDKLKLSAPGPVDFSANVKKKTEGSQAAKAAGLEMDFVEEIVENMAPEVAEDEDEGGNGINFETSLRSFEINPNDVGLVKKRCSELECPLLEEYDFRNDPNNPPLNIDLKPTTFLRPYQEKSLSQMFRNGRARSGMIVLACGAGKTLVGITAACTIKKSVLVLCTGGVSVDQWRDQFLMWSTLSTTQVAAFTSNKKEKLTGDSGVLVTTFSMLTHPNLSAESRKVMDDIQRREWGLLILDEVHVVPANTFRRVIDLIRVHAKLGLTATLVREDELVADLNFLIGPKLYEASWQDLAANGFIAKVQPAEIVCPMTPDFMNQYLIADARRKDLIAAMNPEKFRICQFLIQYHEARGDKILVFSDNVFALQEYAKALKRPFLFGKHSNNVRNEWFQRFRYSPNVMTLFVSKIGDNSIDLPGANVLIQITFMFGSRRQEAQRLGRLLRPKGKKLAEEYNGYFYSLISQDTREVHFSTRRQQFLIKQGYSFKLIQNLPLDDLVNPVLSTKQEQLNLLKRVLAVNDSALEGEKIRGEDEYDKKRGVSISRKKSSSLASKSGGTGVRYVEYHGNQAAYNALRKL